MRDFQYDDLSYEGKKGRIHYTVKAWNGPIRPGDMNKIKQNESLTGKVKFEGIGEFSHERGHLFNTGKLLWKDERNKSYVLGYNHNSYYNHDVFCGNVHLRT